MYRFEHDDSRLCAENERRNCLFPLIEEAADGIYLYIGSRAADGSTAICKVKGLSGEIIWQRDFPCGTEGGVLSTPVLGNGLLGNMVFAQSRRERAKMRSSLRSRQIPARSNGSTAQAGRPLSLPRQDIRPTEPASLLAAGGGNAALLDGGSGEVLASLDGLDGADSASAPITWGNTVILGGAGIIVK